MFEEKTYEQILTEMKARVSDDYDKREGAIIHDTLAPTALTIEDAFSWLGVFMDEMFADTASYYFLIKRAFERGLLPHEETQAVVKMVATPSTAPISLGDKFNLGDFNYTVTSLTDTAGEYQMTCDQYGSAPNQQLGSLIPIETTNDMNDLEDASITEILIPGEDDEDEEAFRERYVGSLNSEAYGGNVTDYVEKVGAIDGVGGVKVKRRWRGGYNPANFIPNSAVQTWYENNIDSLPAAVKTWLTAVYTAALDKYLTVGGTVELIIIDANYSVPSQVLLDLVQVEVDPPLQTGEGVGMAPCGHVVTVSGVVEETIDVELIDAEYDTGYSFPTLKATIEAAIDGFFGDLKRDWAGSQYLTVYRSQLTAALIAIEGIVDIGSLELNGEEENVVLTENQIPKRGEVSG